jgi:hypothetical protein
MCIAPGLAIGNAEQSTKQKSKQGGFNMTRKTGLIITIVVAVLTLCCSFSCCISGIGTLTGAGTYELGVESGALPSWAGLPLVLLALLAWLVPAAAWFFLVRGKTD